MEADPRGNEDTNEGPSVYKKRRETDGGGYEDGLTLDFGATSVLHSFDSFKYQTSEKNSEEFEKMRRDHEDCLRNLSAGINKKKTF